MQIQSLRFQATTLRTLTPITQKDTVKNIWSTSQSHHSPTRLDSCATASPDGAPSSPALSPASSVALDLLLPRNQHHRVAGFCADPAHNCLLPDGVLTHLLTDWAAPVILRVCFRTPVTNAGSLGKFFTLSKSHYPLQNIGNKISSFFMVFLCCDN